MKTPAGIELPDQDNIEIALKLARGKLAGVEPGEAALRLGMEIVESGDEPVVSFEFLGSPITVSLKNGTAFYPGGAPVPDFLLVLVLHYVTSTGRTKANEQVISFVQVPSGSFYEPPFNRRTKARLLDTFGDDPHLLTKAAEKLNWSPGKSGDASAIALPFPKVPVTFAIWGIDEEFPAEASILFNESISTFLPTEDIAMISGLLVGNVVKAATELKGGGL